VITLSLVLCALLNLYLALRKSFSPRNDEDIRQDLLVTVNFTMLNISSNSTLDGAINSVQIMLGLTNTINYVFYATSQTTLLPGMNVVGMSKLSIRQKFGRPTLAALGIMDVSTSHSRNLTENNLL